MRRVLLLAILALLPVFAQAGDKYELTAAGDCPIRTDESLTVRGKTGDMDWLAWQCRPAQADRGKTRYWNRYYLIGNVQQVAKTTPTLAVKVAEAVVLGDGAKAWQLAKGFINKPLTDPMFADAKRAADAALDKIAVPTAVLISNGKPCACEIRSGLGPVHTCIAAADVTPAVATIPGEAEKLPLYACRGT